MGRHITLPLYLHIVSREKEVFIMHHPYPGPYFYYPASYVMVPVYSLQQPRSGISRQYPEVDTTKFEQSTQAYQTLMQDSQTLSEKFIESEQLRVNVMEAAQQSNHQNVIQLIEDTGITHPFEVSYNPDNIKVTLQDNDESPTCKLIMALRW